MELLNWQWLERLHSSFCATSELAMVGESLFRILCNFCTGNGWSVLIQALVQLLPWQWLERLYSGSCVTSELAMVGASSFRPVCNFCIGSGWSVFIRALVQLLNWQWLERHHSGSCATSELAMVGARCVGVGEGGRGYSLFCLLHRLTSNLDF